MRNVTASPGAGMGDAPVVCFISTLRGSSGEVMGYTFFACDRDAISNPGAVMSSADQRPNGLETRSELRQQVAESAVALEKSRARLRNQSRILKSIFDSMAEGVIVADPRGRCLLWNRAAERFLGGAPREVFPDE